MEKRHLAVVRAGSTDITRYSLCGLCVEAGGNVVATNGHYLVALYPTGKREERGGGEVFISHKGVKQLEGMAAALGGSFEIEGSEDGKSASAIGANGLTVPVDRVELGGPWPDWRRVVEPSKPPVVTIGFNVRYLRQICDTIERLYETNKRGDAIFARFEIRGELDAVLIETGEDKRGAKVFAALMPARI